MKSKSWKKFVKQENEQRDVTQTTDNLANLFTQGLSGAAPEQGSLPTLEHFAGHNSRLKGLLSQRNELEQQMANFTGAPADQQYDPRYDNGEIPSTATRRKREAEWLEQRAKSVAAYLKRRQEDSEWSAKRERIKEVSAAPLPDLDTRPQKKDVSDPLPDLDNRARAKTGDNPLYDLDNRIRKKADDVLDRLDARKKSGIDNIEKDVKKVTNSLSDFYEKLDNQVSKYASDDVLPNLDERPRTSNRANPMDELEARARKAADKTGIPERVRKATNWYESREEGLRKVKKPIDKGLEFVERARKKASSVSDELDARRAKLKDMAGDVDKMASSIDKGAARMDDFNKRIEERELKEKWDEVRDKKRALEKKAKTAVKPLKDAWEQARDAKRKAESLKSKFKDKANDKLKLGGRIKSAAARGKCALAKLKAKREAERKEAEKREAQKQKRLEQQREERKEEEKREQQREARKNKKKDRF